MQTMTPAEATNVVGDARHSLAAMAALFGFGLAVAFSPTNFGLQIDALERPGPRWRPVALIAGGTATAATAVAVLFLVVSPNTLHTLWTGHVRALMLQNWLDALVGGVLLAIGVRQWRRASRPRPPARSGRHALDRPRVLFVIVAANTLLSVSNPASVYLVVRTMGTTAWSWWPVEYGIFLAGVLAPYALLGVALTRIPWLGRHVTQLMARLGHHDLRRPFAVGVMALGAALVSWSVWTIAARWT